jgi:predicted secreted protein
MKCFKGLFSSVKSMTVSSFISVVGCTVALFSPAVAGGQIEDPVLSMPDGQVILHISAAERRDVAQDLMVATLSYSAVNTDPRALQSEINSVMRRALDLAKAVAAVRINTGSYQVSEFTEPRTKEKKWRGRQSLTLKSKDAQAVLDLGGKLQEMNLTMNGLTYTLDPKTAVELQDALMEDALKQLQNRADRAAKALGKTSAALRDVSVQGADLPSAVQDGGYMPMMATAEKMQAAPPVAEAGETTITLTVSARALLKP